MTKPTLIDDYLELQKKYISKYGKKTLVMMEVGSFYELYAISENELSDLKEACCIMGIRITRKNNKIENAPINSGNPYMAGVTSIAFTKYMRLLINNNYTIVKIDQVTPPPNPKREVTRVYSPGTYWEETNNKDNFSILSIYVEGLPQENEKINYSIGISVIDLSTGESQVREFHDSKNSDIKMGALAEAYRIIYNYQPLEIIYSSYNADSLDRVVRDKLGISIDHFHNFGEVKNNLLSINYQDTFLRKYYNCSSSINPADYIGLNCSPHALVSFIQILKFTLEHDNLLVKALPKPRLFNDNHQLKVSFGCIEKLDILTHKKGSKSLISLLNLCSTSPGKREFKNRLLNPITDIDRLNSRYEKIETLKDHYSIFEKQLKYAYDLNRLHRKIGLNKIKPYEFYIIHQTYDILLNIIDNLEKQGLSLNILRNKELEKIQEFKLFYDKYNSELNIKVLNRFSNFNEITENIFKPGICSELDNLFLEKRNKKESLDNLRKHLCLLTANPSRDHLGKFFQEDTNFLNSESTLGDLTDIESKKYQIQQKYLNHEEIQAKIYNNIKLEYNEKDGYHFKLTKSRYKELKKNITNNNLKYILDDTTLNEIGRLRFKEKTSDTIITSPFITNHSAQLLEVDNLVKSKSQQVFLDKLKRWYTPQIVDWSNEFLAYIDNLVASAKMATLFNYCKPNIVKKEASGIDAHQVRHSILERLNPNSIFVPNDIKIGSFSSTNGMLITGLNGVGKSIYIKSISIAIILAQAGYYVPATSFTYSPYQKLYTRIGNNDNLFKGQSTFYSEMLELDDILRNCDQNTFVIADELCSGSEQYSAQSILASTIVELTEKKSNFLITTHFHQALELSEITELKDIKFYHFGVEYDKDNDLIIYKRNLREGVGEKLYGIEVCKNIIQNTNFINRCFNFRKKLLIRNDENKNEKDVDTSKYNNKLIVKKCEICGKESTTSGDLHTHHIKEQHEADKHGYIDHFHKNNLGNLVVLCRNHHEMVHHSNLVIHGWKDTINRGRILDYEFIDKTCLKKKKKYNESQIQVVISLKTKTGNKLKMAKKILESDLGFNPISETTIKKMWNNKY